ncbi:MAG: acyl-ACP desaturase [Patescibacteria group bacterium]
MSEKFTPNAYGILIPETRQKPEYQAQRLEDLRLAGGEDRTKTNPLERQHPYNDESLNVEITPEEEYVGIQTYDYYETKLKRLPPWFIKPGNDRVLGRVDLISPRPSRMKKNPGSFVQMPDSKYPSLNMEALAKEKISDDLARVLFGFKIVEDKLADYTGRAGDLFRNYHGISRSYGQWAVEEGQHSEGLQTILALCANTSVEAQEEDYYRNLTHTWEPPFETARQMAGYAAMQEIMTEYAYDVVENRAMEEGAPVTAEILYLIARDEAYHGGGYRKFVEIMAEVDPDGTRADMLYVAENFQMPAQKLIPPDIRKQYLVSSIKVGMNVRQMIRENVLRKVLNQFSFISPELANQAADNYGKKN